MDEAVQQALERDRTIDITTTGRNTGQPRRKEIWFHNSGSTISKDGSTLPARPAVAIGTPTWWQTPNSLFTSSRAPRPI